MAVQCRVRERVSAMDVVPASLEYAASLLAQAHGLDKPPNYVVPKHMQSVSTILLTWSEAPIRSTGTVEPRAKISSKTEKYTHPASPDGCLPFLPACQYASCARCA